MGLQPFDRDLTAARTAYGASRPVPVRPGEGPFTEPRADAQPWRPELVFMPLKRPCARDGGTAQVGGLPTFADLVANG